MPNRHLRQRMGDLVRLPEAAWPALSELSGDMLLVAELVGIERALLLAQVFDGTPIRLYNMRTWIRRHRDRCIRADYDSGSYTVIELARKYHLSDRQISNILGRADDRQLNLFGEKD